MSTSDKLLSFLSEAKSTYHCIASARSRLLEAQFKEISLSANVWDLQPGNKYFFTSNQTTLFAFIVGSSFDTTTSKISIIGSHSDSPTLKIRSKNNLPNKSSGSVCLDFSTYGGGLWSTFFDRDLTVAGRVLYKKSDDSVATKLVHIQKPLLFIPSLAIHLRKNKSEGQQLDLDKDLKPVKKKQKKDEGKKEDNFLVSSTSNSILLQELSSLIDVEPSSILHLDLELADTQPPSILGPRGDFVLGQGLDNKVSAFCSLEALLSLSTTDFSSIKSLVIFDHEEVGSCSNVGAKSNFTSYACERIFSSLNNSSSVGVEGFINRSFIISADGAHAIHPAHSDRSDSQHQCKLGKGVCIKTSAKVKYMTNLSPLSLVMKVSQNNGIPLQWFTGKESVPGGSTIGPHISSHSTMQVLDLGLGMWGMHSIRETCSVVDVEWLVKLLTGVYMSEDDAVVEEIW
ncbi:hypothetical protein GEMRC1_009614 [Eukaryota sp. GEM-RC1]